MEIPGRSRMLLVLLLGGQRLETPGIAVLDSQGSLGVTEKADTELGGRRALLCRRV
jgi:hypothetical protein